MNSVTAQHGRATRAVLAGVIAVALIAAVAFIRERASVEPVAQADLPWVASGRAESIEDGDTFVFVSAPAEGVATRRVRVRLHGVDAPELVQSHGWAARTALVDLLRDARVDVDCYKRDARGRAVCRVSLDAPRTDNRTRDVELLLLEAGHVWHFTAFAREQTAADRERYAAAMASAQAARRGLWQAASPMPPWRCREKLHAGERCD